MTSTGFELDQLAYGISWPARALAAVARLVDPWLSNPVARRAVKASVDFWCAATAVVVAVAVGEGIATFGVTQTMALTLLVLQLFGLVNLTAATTLLLVLLMLFFCVGVRTLRRWSVADAKRRKRPPVAAVASPHRVLIVGAGEHGLSIGRELVKGAAPGVELIGFLDDDPAKIGASLYGVPVLGPVQDALAVAEQHDVREVIVAMPSVKGSVVRALGQRLENAGIRVRAIGGIDRFVRGRDVHRPGTVTLQELLDTPLPMQTYQGTGDGTRRVLVTGGAGLVGSLLTRMLLDRGY